MKERIPASDSALQCMSAGYLLLPCLYLAQCTLEKHDTGPIVLRPPSAIGEVGLLNWALSMVISDSRVAPQTS